MPVSSRARRRDGRRDAILRAAARLFRERGFADTGMRDIAHAADLSAANLYHYFDSKNDLLVYCQDRALDRMLGAVASARRASSSASERLRLTFASHLQTLLDDIEGATAHLQIDSLPPAQRQALVKKRDRYERALRRLIADGIRSGELVDMNPATIARAMLGAMNWTVTWFRPDGSDSAAAVGDLISSYLVRGIAKGECRHEADIMKFRLTCTVNNEPVDLLADDYKTLLEVLREDLQLTGTKHGCELGECGACAVLVDGAPVLSCLVLAIESNGRQITTVEGLAQDGRLHPLQECFADLGAAQCGYCTPGILITAKALLDQEPNPSRERICEALSGNLCRCTGYLQIVEAVEAAAHVQPVAAEPRR